MKSVRLPLVAMVLIACGLNVFVASVFGVGAAAQGVVARPVVIDDVTVQEINTLLDRRSAAIRDGRSDSIALGFHHDVPEETLARWDRLVRGFTAIGLVHYVETVSLPALNLTSASAIATYGPQVTIIEVRREWQLADVDSHPVIDGLFVAVAPAGDEWMIVDDDALRSVGVTSSRTLWEITEVEVVRANGFVVVGDPNISDRLAEVAEIAAQARSQLIDVDVPNPLLVLVPEDADEAAAYLQSPLDLSKFVAFVAFGVDTDHGTGQPGWVAGPPRLILQEGNLRRRSTERQIETLSHELAHAATLHLSGPNEPLWLHEGLADWQAKGHPAGAGGVLELPEGHAFRTGSVSEIVGAYELATDIVSRLGSFDAGLPPLLFETIGRRRSAAGTVEYHVDQALRELGIAQSALEGGPL